MDEPHAAARAALPPAERTFGDQHCRRSADVSGARAPAPAGAPLHAAHPFGDARRGAHHAAARHLKRGARLRAEARRLDRGAARPAAGGARLRARQCGAAARHRPPHRAQARPARQRYGSRPAATANGCCASPARRRTRRAGSPIISSARPSAIWKRRAGSAAERSACASSACRSAINRAAGAHARPPAVLSYSWRLILAPRYVLDYLAAHEVAHLMEMNHSPRFWRLVEKTCANVARAKAWLDVAWHRSAPLWNAGRSELASNCGGRRDYRAANRRCRPSRSSVAARWRRWTGSAPAASDFAPARRAAVKQAGQQATARIPWQAFRRHALDAPRA